MARPTRRESAPSSKACGGPRALRDTCARRLAERRAARVLDLKFAALFVARLSAEYEEAKAELAANTAFTAGRVLTAAE